MHPFKTTHSSNQLAVYVITALVFAGIFGIFIRSAAAPNVVTIDQHVYKSQFTEAEYGMLKSTLRDTTDDDLSEAINILSEKKILSPRENLLNKLVTAFILGRCHAIGNERGFQCLSPERQKETLK